MCDTNHIPIMIQVTVECIIFYMRKHILIYTLTDLKVLISRRRIIWVRPWQQLWEGNHHLILDQHIALLYPHSILELPVAIFNHIINNMSMRAYKFFDVWQGIPRKYQCTIWFNKNVWLFVKDTSTKTKVKESHKLLSW